MRARPVPFPLTTHSISGVRQYDGEGNLNFQFGKLVDAREFARRGIHFITNGDVVIYPGQKLMLCGMTCEMVSQDQALPAVRYKIFAENMLPKEGEKARS